jgi:hypothetical protein
MPCSDDRERDAPKRDRGKAFRTKSFLPRPVIVSATTRRESPKHLSAPGLYDGALRQ